MSYYNNKRDRSSNYYRGRGSNYRDCSNYPSYQPNLTKEEYDVMNIGYSDLFNKEYSFPLLNTSKDETLITNKLFTTERWSIPEMMKLKDSINETRNRLNEKDISVWHVHTRKTNMTGQVVFTLRNNYNIEMCTNAWIKMAELLHKYSLIPPNLLNKCFRSLHICEAPGAFICATNHKLRQLYGNRVQWNWTGLSLNPYYEGNDNSAMVDDDRFIVETYKSWYFGVDDSGNILKQENIHSLWKQPKAALVTADGSVDTSGDPNEQESIVSELHYAEAVTALGALEKGGALVLKMFNVFECETICLLYIISLYFKELFVTKPATSKAGNAETYIVARGFCGISNDILEHLLYFVSPAFPENKAILPQNSIQQSFLDSMYDCAKYFTERQKQSIERNLALERLWNFNVQKAVANQVRQVTNEYISRYGVRQIDSRDRIVTKIELDGSAKNLGNSASLARGGLKQRTGGTLEDRRNNKRDREEFLSGHQESDTQISKKINLGQDRSVVPERDVSSSSLEVSSSVTSSASDISLGMKLLKKAGYKEGHGLGVAEQGRVTPIEVSRREDLVGLGHHKGIIGREEVDDRMPTIPDEPFFEMNKRPLYVAIYPDSNPIVPNAIFQGDKIKSVITSLFVRPAELEALYKAREETHRVLIEPDLFKAYSKELFLSDCLEKIPFVVHFKHPKEALQLSSLDKQFNLFPQTASQDQFPIIVIADNQSAEGFIEYISWQQQNLIDAHIFSHLPTTSSSSTQITYHSVDNQLLKVEHLVQTKVSLFIGEVSVSSDIIMKSRYVEYDTKLQFAQICRNALISLAENGHFVCKITDVYTRFTAGIIYLLYKTFKSVNLWKTFTLNPTQPDRFLICQGFVSSKCKGFIDHLDNIISLLRGGKGDLLEIVSITCLLERQFQTYLADSAQELIKREIAALRKLLWYHKNDKLSCMSVDKYLSDAAKLLNRTRRAVVEPDEGIKLPEGWSKQFSEKQQLFYYFNSNTGESIWESDWKH